MFHSCSSFLHFFSLGRDMNFVIVLLHINQENSSFFPSTMSNSWWKCRNNQFFFPFHYLISNSKRFFNLCWHCEQYKFENGKIRIFRCASCTIFFISSNYNLLNEHFWLKKSVLCKHPAQDRAAAQVSKKVILPTNVYWGVKQTK